MLFIDIRKQVINTLKNMIKIKNLPVDSFKLIEDASKFNKDFMKVYNEGSDIGYCSEINVYYP